MAQIYFDEGFSSKNGNQRLVTILPISGMIKVGWLNWSKNVVLRKLSAVSHNNSRLQFLLTIFNIFCVLRLYKKSQAILTPRN